MHLSASISTGKAPMNPTSPDIALSRQGHNALPDALRFLGRKRLVEAGRGMRVEVVHHQADHARLGIDLIDQPADRLREIEPGALLGQFDRTPPGQRFDKHKQVRRPQTLVLRDGWAYKSNTSSMAATKSASTLGMHHCSCCQGFSAFF